MSRPPVLLVVGGGLSGLVAAHEARALVPDAEILLVEASGRPGGKLETVDFPSGPMELGAEAFIRRRPEAAELVAELGLESRLHHPSDRGSAILSGGRLHPMPAGTLMGLPSDAHALSGLLAPGEVDRAAREAELPLDWTPGGDVPLGGFVAERFGPAVVTRLVDPMLGGVYAAPSAGLGLREVVPGLAERLDAGAASLTEAARDLVSRRVPGPVFATFDGGYRTLVDALLASSGARLRTDTRVAALSAGPGGVGPVAAELHGPGGVERVSADAVVLAVPVPEAVPLLRPLAPTAADELSAVPTASSAVVALEVDRSLVLPEHSGVLVATDEPVPFKAITFSSRKWPHLDDRPGHLLRVSFGRLGATEVLAHDDAGLVDLAREALVTVTGGAPEILHARVRRWTDGLPGIGPGHSDRIAGIRARLAAEAPLVELVGAATEGVGVPACIGSARAAARRLAARWQD